MIYRSIHSLLVLLVSSFMCMSQPLTISEFYAAHDTLDHESSSTRVDFDDHFSIIYALDFKDGRKLIFGEYNDITISGNDTANPNSYTNIFLDSNNEIIKRVDGYEIISNEDIVYATLIDDLGLLWIDNTGDVHYVADVFEFGFGPNISYRSIFDLGEIGQRVSKTTIVIRIGNYLTVVSEASEGSNIGTLHTIIKIDTQEEISNFFIPTPEFLNDTYRMNGLAYLSYDELVGTYSSRIDSLSDYLCIMDRQRNILSEVELEAGFKVNDMILDSNNDIVLVGVSDESAHIKIVNRDGSLIWESKKDNYSDTGEVLRKNAFYKALLTPTGELLVSGYDRNVWASTGSFVGVTCFDVANETSFHVGEAWQLHGLRHKRFYYTNNGSVYMLVNVSHTGGRSGRVLEIKFLDSTSGIDKLQVDNLKTVVYPNPFTNNINIDLPFGFSETQTTFKLFDTMGQLVLSGNYQARLNLKDLGGGHYYLDLEDKEHHVVIPIISLK